MSLSCGQGSRPVATSFGHLAGNGEMKPKIKLLLPALLFNHKVNDY